MTPATSTRVARSMELYERARRIIAGRTHLFGRRAELHAIGFSPVYSGRQKAGRFWDVDGQEYIDFNMGAGAVLLGHAYDPVVRAVQEQAALGTGLSINHPLELEVAELLQQLVPCAEMVRFAKGGGEANMVAVRIARAATGRDKVVFCGYHGWHDWYIAANLTSEDTLVGHLLPGITPRGVPKALKGTAIPFEYNNLASLESVLESNRGDVACVIMEAARFTLPEPGFLEGVRDLTRKHGVVLIFDEVVTGFRIHRNGAQGLFGVTPDVATFAKCISNGFSLGAIAGRREVMEAALDSFISSVYWADATGLAAGKASLTEYLNRDIAAAIGDFGRALLTEMLKHIAAIGVPMKVVGFPQVATLSFDGVPAEQMPAISTLYMQETARRGQFGGPMHYLCLQHDQRDIEQASRIFGETLTVIRKALDDGAPEKFLECPVRQSGFRRMV